MDREFYIVLGILTAIIWIVIGWRAMRAHEKIADSVLRHVNALSRDDPHNLRGEDASVVRQADCILLSFLRPRFTFSRISAAVAVQMNGLGSELCASI